MVKIEWPDVYRSAFEELGLSEKQFWKLDWYEFERKEQHLRFQLARQWEPIRELQTMLYNMFADKPATREELLPLLTDRYVPKAQLPAHDLAASKALWARLMADTPSEEPKNDH